MSAYTRVRQLLKMARRFLWSLLVGVIISPTTLQVSAQTSEICDHNCQVSCQANFTECYKGYPQNPAGPGGCDAIRGVVECFKQRLKPECRSAPGMHVSIQSVEDAVDMVCGSPGAATAAPLDRGSDSGARTTLQTDFSLVPMAAILVLWLSVGI